MTTFIRSWHPGDPKPLGVTKFRIPRTTPPFARRLLAKQLPPKEFCTGSYKPAGSDDAA